MHQGLGVSWVKIVDARLGLEGVVPPRPLQHMPSGALPGVKGKAIHGVVLLHSSSIMV